MNFIQKKIILFFLLISQIPIVGGCETLYTGKGYSVHNDKEAMDFAWVWFNQKDYESASHSANLALSINSENIDAHNLLGIILLKKNDSEKGVEYLEKANNLVKKLNTPHPEHILNNLGYAYYNNNQYEKAIEVFEKAFRINRNWISNFGVALSLYNLGNKTEAMKKIQYCENEPDFKNKANEILEYFNISVDKNLTGILGLKKTEKK